MEDELKQVYKEMADLKLKLHNLEIRYANSQQMLLSYREEMLAKTTHYRQTHGTNFLEEVRE